MRVRDLHAPPLENQQQRAPDYRDLYHRAAEAIAEDCRSLPPAWLLDRPEFYQRIRTLDDRLTEMEQEAASESEYQAVLTQLVRVVQDARAVCEREQGEEKEVRQ